MNLSSLSKTAKAAIISGSILLTSVGVIELSGAIGGHTPNGINYAVVAAKYAHFERKYAEGLNNYREYVSKQAILVNPEPSDPVDFATGVVNVWKFKHNRGKGKLLAIPNKVTSSNSKLYSYVYYDPQQYNTENVKKYIAQCKQDYKVLEDWEAVNAFLGEIKPCENRSTLVVLPPPEVIVPDDPKKSSV